MQFLKASKQEIFTHQCWFDRCVQILSRCPSCWRLTGFGSKSTLEVAIVAQVAVLYCVEDICLC